MESDKKYFCEDCGRKCLVTEMADDCEACGAMLCFDCEHGVWACAYCEDMMCSYTESEHDDCNENSHLDNERIYSLLEESKCLWVSRVSDSGDRISCYSTKAGLVLFQDLIGGGWVMYTEYPSNNISDNIEVLSKMING